MPYILFNNTAIKTQPVGEQELIFPYSTNTMFRLPKNKANLPKAYFKTFSADKNMDVLGGTFVELPELEIQLPVGNYRLRQTVGVEILNTSVQNAQILSIRMTVNTPGATSQSTFYESITGTGTGVNAGVSSGALTNESAVTPRIIGVTNFPGTYAVGASTVIQNSVILRLLETSTLKFFGYPFATSAVFSKIRAGSGMCIEVLGGSIF